MEERVETTSVPPGYMQDAQGRLVPEKLVSDYDKARDALVRELVVGADRVVEVMRRYKGTVMGDMEAFVELAHEKYEAKLGGTKGNVSLTTYDGQYKVSRSVSEHLVFDEQLQVAKSLVDECLKDWTEGSPVELQTIINDAFQVDKEGRVNTGRILGLRKLEIDDPRWKSAMKAINEALTVSGSKTYFRIHKRRESDGKYVQLPLDFAAL